MTTDTQGRLRRHNSKSTGFTARANDWIIKYTEVHNDKKTASAREKQIKGRKSRQFIEKLISSASREHSD